MPCRAPPPCWGFPSACFPFRHREHSTKERTEERIKERKAKEIDRPQGGPGRLFSPHPPPQLLPTSSSFPPPLPPPPPPRPPRLPPPAVAIVAISPISGLRAGQNRPRILEEQRNTFGGRGGFHLLRHSLPMARHLRIHRQLSQRQIPLVQQQPKSPVSHARIQAGPWQWLFCPTHSLRRPMLLLNSRGFALV